MYLPQNVSRVVTQTPVIGYKTDDWLSCVTIDDRYPPTTCHHSYSVKGQQRPCPSFLAAVVKDDAVASSGVGLFA